VLVADDGAPLTAGVVLLPPSGSHLLVLPQDRTVLLATGPVPPARPSADLLPASLLVSCGPRAIAVVLSGGGHDGATGARGVRRRGGTLRVQEAAAAEAPGILTAADSGHRGVPLDIAAAGAVGLAPSCGRVARYRATAPLLGHDLG